MRHFFLFIILTSAALAGNSDSSGVTSRVEFSPVVQRITGEGGLAPFFYGYSGTLDVSLARVHSKKEFEIGGRIVVAKWKGGGGGDAEGPAVYLQVVDVLLMTTMKHPTTRANAFLGYSRLSYWKNTTDPPRNLTKLGVELNYLFIPPVAALMMRVSVSPGFPVLTLGISIGYFN
jgi:hypothetical protein